MFITIGNIAQYMTGFGAEALLVTGNARIATALEAAECISRMVFNGDSKMNEANDDFKRIYSNPLSASEVRMPVPNKAMEGFNANNEAHEVLCK